MQAIKPEIKLSPLGSVPFRIFFTSLRKDFLLSWTRFMKHFNSLCSGIVLACFFISQNLFGFSGTEGASFLELPAGARPAALGGAYSSLASDAYAPTFNPGGLGFLQSPQVSAMHLLYVQDTSTEYLSYVQPITSGHAIGFAAQYFRPGTITATDTAGNTIGDFGGYYGAYSLAYGQKLTDWASLGATGKWISAKIDNVTASAFAADVGALFQCTPNWRISAVASNYGGKLTFLQQSDPLPSLWRVGTAYRPLQSLTLVLEGTHRQSGLNSAAGGIEWSNAQGYSIRGGYDTEHTQGLSALSGMTLGLGLNLWGQELAYAWSPLSDLGSAHYFSLVFRFGEEHKELLKRSEIDEEGADFNSDMNDVSGGSSDSSTPSLGNP